MKQRERRLAETVFLALLATTVMTGCAVSKETLRKTPVSQWTEARMIDSCTEAMPPGGMIKEMPASGRAPLPVPVPPFGTWKELPDNRVSATGLTNCWSTILAPADEKNCEIKVRFSVTGSSGAKRQLPGGCVRWGFHYGENLPGWDVGVVLGYQDPLNFYRLQFSAVRGEMALWDSRGGFLQLIPCKITIGKPQDLVIRWRGAHFSAELNGKKVMDYWDRTLPYTHGQVGLTVWKSKAQFEGFSVTDLTGDAIKMPPHKPNFRFEATDNIIDGHPAFRMTAQKGLILFDGFEPISFFYKQKFDSKPRNDMLMQSSVKLKPGWTPSFYTFSGVGPLGIDGTPVHPALVGELPGAFQVKGGGETIQFSFKTANGKLATTDFIGTVRYDHDTGVYRYEYQGKITAHADIKPYPGYGIELIDPLFYNNRPPGPNVKHRWHWNGLRWWVYKTGPKTWERFHYASYYHSYSAKLCQAKVTKMPVEFFLYPDPAACPQVKLDVDWKPTAKSSFELGMCHWGFDYHTRGRQYPPMTPGMTRSFSYSYSALLPSAARKIFTESRLSQAVQNEKRELIPFDPAGNDFSETKTWRDAELPWLVWVGGEQDKSTGHNDGVSLRLDGPGKVKAEIYQNMIEQYAERWWIRGWYKTKDLGHSNLKLIVEYPPKREVFQLPAKDGEWTYFSVTTDMFLLRDCTHLIFELDGKGQVWFDDIAVSAVSGKENPKTTAVGRKPKTGK